MTKIKFINKFFYIAIVFFALGIICLAVPAKTILPIIYRAVCIFIVSIGIFKLVMCDINVLGKREYYLDIVEGVINLIVGVVCFNFYHIYVVSLIFGLLYLIMPILRVLLSMNKINQILMDIFKFIFAIVIMSSTTKMPNIVKMFVAIVFITFGVMILVYKYVVHKSQYRRERVE